MCVYIIPSVRALASGDEFAQRSLLVTRSLCSKAKGIQYELVFHLRCDGHRLWIYSQG